MFQFAWVVCTLQLEQFGTDKFSTLDGLHSSRNAIPIDTNVCVHFKGGCLRNVDNNLSAPCDASTAAPITVCLRLVAAAGALAKENYGWRLWCQRFGFVQGGSFCYFKFKQNITKNGARVHQHSKCDPGSKSTLELQAGKSADINMRCLWRHFSDLYCHLGYLGSRTDLSKKTTINWENNPRKRIGKTFWGIYFLYKREALSCNN